MALPTTGRAPHQAVRIGDLKLTYDANGNTSVQCHAGVGICAGTASVDVTGLPASHDHWRRYDWTEENWLRQVTDGGGHETRFLYDGSVVFDPATPPPALDKDRLISVVSTTRDLLDDGTWTVVGHAPGCIPRSQWPNEAFAKDGYVGAVTFGSGIVNKFLAAYHGMFPWNGFKDPNYFERLLVPAAKPPPPSRLLFNPTARPAREIFQSAARSLGDLAGVFEYEGETGYFYLYALEDAEGHEVLDAIHIVSGDADFAEGEVQVRWTREEDRVGLFIRETLWAVFDCQTRTKHGGDYRRGETPALPPHVTEPFD